MTTSTWYKANSANIKAQLTTIINNTKMTKGTLGASLSAIVLTTPEELNRLQQFVQDENDRMQEADAGIVFCIDYLPLRKTCPDKQEFYCNDLFGLLTGIASAAHMAEAVATKAVNYGWEVAFISDIFSKAAALQKQLNLPALVLPVSVMVLSKNELAVLGDWNHSCCSIHWGRYDEQNLDIKQARSWWQKETQAWHYGRAARYLALNQLYEALDSFGLMLRGILKPDSKTELPKDNIKRALLQVAQKYPRAFLSWQRMRLSWARRCFFAGKIARSERFVEQAMTMEPDAPDILITAGILQWAQGQLQNALKTLTQAQKQSSNEESFICYLIGEIYHEQGLLGPAYKMLNRSVQLNQEDSTAWLALAKVVEESRGPRAALSIFKQARDAVSSLNATLLNNEGLCHSELGQDNEALTCFQQALVLRPNDPTVLANQGLILGRQGKIEAALKCYEQALKINPSNTYLLNNKGFCLGKMEQYAEALRCYEKALITEGQNDTSLLHNKATCLTKLGRHKEALACYDQVLQHNPTDTATLNNRGLCLLNLGRVRDAVACYDMAIKLEPHNAVLWGNKGASLFKQGKYEEGLVAYDKALELAPHELAYYSGKGMCLDYLGRGEEAVACYNRALQLA
jgi:tetratricopeptide (TPR) repeat protein